MCLSLKQHYVRILDRNISCRIMLMNIDRVTMVKRPGASEENCVTLQKHQVIPTATRLQLARGDASTHTT